MRLIFTLITLLFLSGLSAQNIVIKPVNDSLRILNAEAQKVKQVCYTDLAKSKRLRFLAAPAPNDPAATHLLDFAPTCTVEKKFGQPSFVDSTKTINILASCNVSVGIGITCYNIESGSIVGVQNVSKPKNWQKSYSLTYADAGYVKGVTKNDRDFQRKLENLVRKKNDYDLNEAYKTTFDGALNEAKTAARETLNTFFPFRLDVLEITESKGDKAKNVLISGGSAFDVTKRDRLVVFKITTYESNGKKYERLTPVGRLKFEEDDPKGGKAEVVRGEKTILQEFNAKTPLYCNPGFTPTALKDDRKTIKIAIASFETDGYTPAQRQALYKRAEIELYSTKSFSLVERQRMGLLEAEKQFQKSDAMVDKTSIDQYKSAGADLLLTLKIGSPAVSSFESQNSATGQNERMQVIKAPVQLRLLDVETGEILDNENSTAQISFPAANTPTSMRAQDLAANGIYLGVSALLKRVFPPTIAVIEVLDEDRKGGADEVLLSGDVEFATFNKYKVMREKKITVDGQEMIRMEEIGEVSVRVPEGEGLVSAKVKDGSKEIAEALKSGQRLVCVDQPGMLEKMTARSLKLASKLNPGLKD